LVFNKVDLIDDARIETLKLAFPDDEQCFVSVKAGTGLEELKQLLRSVSL
jgi:50S ribosomal subunit-associated GTPase HflX